MMEATFTEAHRLALKRFDEAMTASRRIHADLEFSNNINPAYKKTVEEVNYAVDAIWRLKDAYSDYLAHKKKEIG